MRRFWILLHLFPCFLGAFEWTEVKYEWELGYQYAAGFEQNGTTRSRPYLLAKASYSESCGNSDHSPDTRPRDIPELKNDPQISKADTKKDPKKSIVKIDPKSDEIIAAVSAAEMNIGHHTAEVESHTNNEAGVKHDSPLDNPAETLENKIQDAANKPESIEGESEDKLERESRPEREFEPGIKAQESKETEAQPEEHFESEVEKEVSQESCPSEGYGAQIDEGTCLNSYEFSYRIWYDFARVDQYKNFDIRSLFYERSGENWSIKIGFQEIAWGETFGLYIADFVNPRDLTDPFFNDLSYVRIPVFIINTQFFNEPWSFQLVATPVPRNNLLPAKGDPFDVFPKQLQNAPVLGPHRFSVDRLGQDIEYGGRVGYFFESGWDVALFYYRHWNRFPTYRIIVDNLRPALKPVLRRINCCGGSFSKAYDTIVLRGDTVINFHTPWTVERFGTVKRRLVAQTILGMDYSGEDNLILGLQLHWDQWREAGLISTSLRVVKDFGKKLQYHLFFFVYKGLNNQDLWIQPRFDWDITDSINLSIRVDVFGGYPGKGTPADGFIGPYKHKERVFTWLTYKF